VQNMSRQTRPRMASGKAERISLAGAEMTYTPRTKSDATIKPRVAASITLPRLPFDTPAATLDETAPHHPIIKARRISGPLRGVALMSHKNALMGVFHAALREALSDRVME